MAINVLVELSFIWLKIKKRKRENSQEIIVTFTIIISNKTVCREDSYHSVVSCAAVVLTPMDPTIEMKKREELKFPEPSKQ